MSNLAHRQSKIQDKRKQTPWREFVMEICSWSCIIYNKDRGIISKYPKSNRIIGVVNSKEFGERHHTTDQIFGENIFFDNFISLIQNIYFPALRNVNSENCNFADIVINSKGAYLSNIVISGSENVLYSTSIKESSKNIIQSLMVRANSENIFSSQGIIQSYNIFYSHNIHNSSNVWFSSNLIGCNECINCNNLENCSFYINNSPYSIQEFKIFKDDFLRKKNNFNNQYNSNKNIQGKNIACSNVIGNSNIQSSNIKNAYYCYNVNGGNNLFLHGSKQGSEECYDCYVGGSPYSNHFYGVLAAGAGEHLYCTMMADEGNSNLYYCMYCDSCSFCLGCIGLKNKSYCILNKQYSKEERYIRVDEIFSQMESEGTLGQFFPATMNPFYFNDTAAYLIDPSFTKEKVTAAGYLWRDEPIKVDIPDGAVVVKTTELGIYEGWMVGTEFFPSTTDRKNSIPTNAIRHINPDILKVIIQDEQGNVYKIVKMEYDFLMKHGLPLPRKHWLERMKENFRIS